MAVVVETGLRRQYVGGSATSTVLRFQHAAGICTIINSFTFLLALVIGLIS